MQTNDYSTHLKDSLWAAIAKHESLDITKKIIALIKESCENNFRNKDNNGLNILSFALNAKYYEAAALLFQELKEDEIVLSYDSYNRSAIWYAAASGYYEKCNLLSVWSRPAKTNFPQSSFQREKTYIWYNNRLFYSSNNECIELIRKDSARLKEFYETFKPTDKCRYLSLKELEQIRLITGHNHVHVLRELIKIARKSEQAWCVADNKGNTPLHAAVQEFNVSAFNILLAELEQEQEQNNLINSINNKGETALHLACRQKLTPFISVLINQGADLNLKDDIGISPSALIFKLPVDHIYLIFSQLTNRQYFYESYFKALTLNPDLDKSICFKMAAALSLKTLLVAHHELDPSIPLRANYYCNAKIIKSKENNDITRLVEEFLTEETLNELPFYTERLRAAGKISIDINQQILDRPDSFSMDLSEKYQSVAHDRQLLKTLILDIETYLTNLRSQPHYSYRNRLLMIWVPVIIFLILGASLTPIFLKGSFYLKKYKECNTDIDYRYDPIKAAEQFKKCHVWLNEYTPLDVTKSFEYKAITYIVSGICALVFSGIAISGVRGYIANKHGSSDRKVSCQEWEIILNQLIKIESLLKSLKDWRHKNNAIPEDPYLPIVEENLQRLTEYISFLKLDQKYNDVIANLLQINSELDTLCTSIISKQKPISLFFKTSPQIPDKNKVNPSIILEIMEDKDFIEDAENNQDERTPFLSLV